MLITFSGPSTVGKDSTWVRVAESMGFARVVPYTTRVRRTGEVNGTHHHYVTAEVFQDMIRNGNVTEWDYVLAAYYGTDAALAERLATGEDLVLQVLARMAIRLKARLRSVVTVLLTTSDPANLKERLVQRGYSGSEIEQRLQHGEEELVHAPLFDFVIPDADILTDGEVLRVLRDVVGLRNGGS